MRNNRLMQLLTDLLDHHNNEENMKKGSIPVERGESEKEGHAWGHGEYANMPQEVHMQEHAFPMARLSGMALNDTMARLDGDTMQANKGARKGLERGMY